MCTVCGCDTATTGSTPVPRAGAEPGARHHKHEDQDHAGHGDDHESHHHSHADDREHLMEVEASGSEKRRLVRVEQDILAYNDRLATRNRALFRARRILGLNLMSGPGSGKTTLLVRTIADLGGSVPITVIEGDQETSFDAERVRTAGVRAVQINTGKGCHLDAQMVAKALSTLAPDENSVVFIENVGNLVCPAAFDLGEAARIVLLSVTEGDNKPLKYANMFARAKLMLVTKADLLPFVPFDVERCSAFARRVNTAIEVIPVSAINGAGLNCWYDWIARRRSDLRGPESIATGAIAE